MKITPDLTDNAVLREIAFRLARRRIDTNLTQADLAQQAGVSKRTLERIEAGQSTDVSWLIRTLRALGLFDELNGLVPDLPLSPMALIKQRGRERKRVGHTRGSKSPVSRAPSHAWKWGE